MRLSDQLNAEMARCTHQGHFRGCQPGEPCQNCACQLRRHFRQNTIGFAIACHDCPCEVWCCQHGGQRVMVPSAG